MASVLYVANTTAQTVLADGTINLGSIVRKTCCSQANLSGNGITLTGTGYYTVDVSATFNGDDAGSAVIQLYKDGAAVPGAVAIQTITTAGTEVRSISFTAEVRNVCCDNFATLTLVNGSTIGLTLTNVAVRVKRDA